ncbi:MAG: S8 family serine peptidase [Caldilineales bacterium]
MMHRRSHVHSLIVALLFASLLFGGGILLPAQTPLAAATAQAAPIDPALQAAFAHAPQGQQRFIVLFREQADLSAADKIDDWDAKGQYVYTALTATANRAQSALIQALRSQRLAGEVSYFQPYWIVNAIVVQGDLRAAQAIAAYPQVERIVPEGKPEPPQPVEENATVAPEAIAWGVAKIRADQVWSVYGVRGEGVVAANIDTGVRYSHEALVRQFRGNATGTVGGPFNGDYSWWDARTLPSVGGTPSALPEAVEGTHGTHVMGSEVGEDAALNNQVGVAPGADWIAAYGCCPNDEALLGAMQWMLAPTKLDGTSPDPAMRPHVVQNSWGGPGGYVYYNTAIGNLRAAGVFSSFSAGNNGSSCGTLGSPGDNLNSFNVGSTTSSDAISSFSSRGPNPFTGSIGPDISAPGSSIYSSVSTGDNSYGFSSGTSMAGPHNAGAVALLWSLEPALIGKVAQTEALLRGTATPLTSSQTCGGVAGSQIPNNAFGWGRLDVKAAADMIYQAGVLRGVVTAGGSPVADALVSITRSGKTLRQITNAAGEYSFVIGAGSYDMQVSAYGYNPASASAVVVVMDTDTVQNFELLAQAVYTVSGVVTSGGVTPIWGARVFLKGQPALSVISNSTGQYSLNLPAGSYTLRAEMSGFTPLEVAITVNANLVQNLALTATTDYYALISGQSLTCPVQYNWIELQGAAGVSTLSLDDDASSLVTMGLSWPMYGTSYSSAYITSNGFVQFGQNQPRPHGIIPFEGAPNNAVYAFTTDLNPSFGTQGLIYHKASGSQWVVQYDAVQHWPAGWPETFELVFDNSDNSVTLQYQTVDLPDDTMVGIENSNGSAGVLVSKANMPPLSDGMAIKFMPFSGLNGAHNKADVNCDGVVDVQDITLLANNWQAISGDGIYLLGYDMDMDSDNDIADIQYVAGWWGWAAQ